MPYFRSVVTLWTILIPLFGIQPEPLTLVVGQSTLGKDHNTSVRLLAADKEGRSEDVTDKALWLATPSDAIRIEGYTLTALKDGNVTLQARYQGKTSNEVKLHIYWEVNGHRLPPEPDPKINNATLLGVDVNRNGVRDDVERWIYEKYKDKHPIHIDIAMQAAKAYKLILEHPERAKEIHDEVRKAIQCEMYYSMFADLYNEPLLVKENIASKYFRHKIYFNTNKRIDAYIKYDAFLSGDSYTLPSDQEKKAACDFNTSKYDKE
ncbi:hypothetical protein [Hydrogenimonas sp.]